MHVVARYSAAAVMSADCFLVWRLEQAVDRPVFEPMSQWQRATHIANAVRCFELELVSDRGSDILHTMAVDENSQGRPSTATQIGHPSPPRGWSLKTSTPREMTYVTRRVLTSRARKVRGTLTSSAMTRVRWFRSRRSTSSTERGGVPSWSVALAAPPSAS